MTTPEDPSEPYGSPPPPPPPYSGGQEPYGSPAPPPPPYSGSQEPYGQPPQGPPAYTGAGDQYGQQTSQYAGAELATWIRRVGGFLLDFVIFVIPLGIIEAVIGNHAVSDVLSILLSLGLGYWVGSQGQTPGMRIVGIKLVRDADGALLGGGLGIVRAICHFLDTIACLVGWFWPLWDNKRQTFADKLVSTVVLKL